MSVNEALQEADNALDTHIGIDEQEVKEIIESIKEAQYFDASSMAPLTPASLVSIFHACLRLRL
jgi:coenzyme A diphosphatase NUDT7